MQKRSSNTGTPFINDLAFDTELTEDLIGNMASGKAAGLDGLTAEHFCTAHFWLNCLT